MRAICGGLESESTQVSISNQADLSGVGAGVALGGVTGVGVPLQKSERSRAEREMDFINGVLMRIG